jgi:Fascin domain-containing protein
MRLKDLGYSKLALIFTLLFVWSAILINQKWKNDDVISNDMNFYYIYLPAIFIYHDITLNYTDTKLPMEVFRSSWKLKTEDGKHFVSKMSCGNAIMLSPFFLTAHLYETVTKGDPNGYSTTYRIFICLASFFYLLIGLFYQYKILSRFFDQRTVGFTLIALGLGTNLYAYSTCFFSNPHVFSFALFSLFIWKTIQWHIIPNTKNSIIIGLLLGLITLVRPSDIVIILFFALYGIFNKNSFKQKVKLLLKNWKQLFLILIFLFVGITPQLIIWKIQTGHFIYYSYQSERFYFNHPHIIDGLFSFRNGMFIYAPVLLLIIPGFIYVWKKKYNFAFSSIIFFIINCFIVFSWWCWWYGGSFGIRAMIESYAILALPLGSLVFEFGKNSKVRKYILLSFLIITVTLNQFQTLQAETSLLHYSDMTFKTYKLIWGRLTWPNGYDESLNHPDIENASHGIPERDFTKTFPFLKNGNIRNVSIRASNGKFVSADQNINGILVADRIQIREWETFRLTMEDFGKCKLKSSFNKYISVENNSELIANKNEANAWEQFTIEKLPDNKFAIKAYNGKYLKPDSLNNNILLAASDKINEDEEFEITSR